MSDEIETTAPEVEAAEEAAEEQVEMISPVIVDLGKIKSSKIKRLKKGKGPLVDELFDVMDDVAEALGDEFEGKTLVPVVMVYEKKRKKGGKGKRRRIVLPF